VLHSSSELIVFSNLNTLHVIYCAPRHSRLSLGLCIAFVLLHRVLSNTICLERTTYSIIIPNIDYVFFSVSARLQHSSAGQTVLLSEIRACHNYTSTSTALQKGHLQFNDSCRHWVDSTPPQIAIAACGVVLSSRP
jgi:hypothetical protein